MADAHTKALFSASFTVSPPPVIYEPDFYAKPYNINRQLFVTVPQMFPRFPVDIATQKAVICEYVKAHGIKQDGMLDFWKEYVRCLLACFRFEEDAPLVFKSWAYGRLCRYVLLSDQQQTLSV